MNEFVERISKLSPKRLVLLAAELQARVQALEAERDRAESVSDRSSLPDGRGSDRAESVSDRSSLPDGRGSDRAESVSDRSPLPDGRGSDRAESVSDRSSLPDGRGSGRTASDDHAIAVIGLGLRFPGGAQHPNGIQDPAAFWDFLCAGGDGIRKAPAERWDVDALYDPDPDAPGKLASVWGGFVDGIDQFDPQHFGITPREANSMDPQQRMMLEVCWEALERAGYAPDRLGGSATGVFAGACNGDYYQMELDSGVQNLEMYTATGGAHSVISGRISYVLGLQGPSLTVDTACSSSLVALHLACQSLRNGECRMALAGGVNAILSPDTTIVLSKAKMMAPDGRCKAFSAAADGFVRSEGCGVVVLKRLADALADGDAVLAVVRGSAMNQDGRSNGLTAPNGPSQVAVVRRALADAGVEPQSIGYVETHGTGTSLGDPIEVQALAEALGAGRPADQPLLIGSVKTNIGHLESAAGVAGFIKLVLALQHRAIPPHLHLAQLNPYIAWDELLVHVPAAGAPWAAGNGRRLGGGRRIGGVSSFGFSGTNVHMILEEAPVPLRTPAVGGGEAAEDRPLHLVALSARSEAALHAQARNLAGFLAAGNAELADVAYTANTGRALFAHRLALPVANSDEALAGLQAFLQNAEDAPFRCGHAPGNRRPAVAFLFSGHGGQYKGMGRELYAAQPVFRRAVDECDALFRPLLGTSLLAMFEPGDRGAAGEPDTAGANTAGASWMESMTFAQPALFALQVGLARMWESWGVEAAAVTGHSIGEYAAAHVAGVLGLADAVKLVAARSRLMDAIPEKGVMAAVFAGEEVVAPVLATELPAHLARQVAIAAINGPQATVISGSSAAVDAVVAALGRQRVRCRRLAVAQGAHSPLIDSVLDEFAGVAVGVTYAEPQIPFVSSLLGRAVEAGEINHAGYWRRHLRQTVRFADAMQALHASGYDTFVEIGPSPMLAAMGQRCLPDGVGVWAPSLRPPGAQTGSSLPASSSVPTQSPAGEWRQLLDSAAVLFVHGVEIDWAAFDQPYDRQRLALPTYPFERQRYWFTPHHPATLPATGQTPRHPLTRSPAHPLTLSPSHPLLARQLRSSALAATVFESEIGRHQPAFLDHHTIFGAVILPSPAYVEMALAAAAQTGAQLPPGRSHALANFTIHAPLLLPETGTRTVQLVLDPPAAAGAQRFQVLAWEAAASKGAGSDAGSWRLHATGELATVDAPAPAGDFDPAPLQARCPQQVSGDAYYEQVSALGLEFGDSFRGISQVWIGEGEALGRVQLPGALAAEAQQYRFHPALLDACFHLLGAPLARHDMDAAYLLIGIERLVLHRSPGPGLWNHTRIVLAPGNGSGGGAAEYYTGDIHLYDDAGQLVAEVSGLQLKRADRAALLRAAGVRPAAPSPDEWLYRLEWMEADPAPAAGAPGRPQPEAQTWLIFADAPVGGEQGVGERLARLLAARGDRCVVVPGAEGPLDAGQLAALLAQDDLHTVHRVVYLRGITAMSAPAADEGCTTAELLRLVQALARQPGSEQPVPGRIARTPRAVAPGALWVVTRGAQPVTSAPDAAGVRQSPLWGLGRVAALEQPQVWGGLIDLNAGDTTADLDSAAAHLLAELDNSAGSVSGLGWEDQIAWRNGRRYVLRLLPAPRPPAQQPALRRDAAYLITGGLGGLGLAVAAFLAQQGAGHLVLTGRRGLTDQGAAIAAIERAGAAVTVVAADVADETEMAALFARFGRDLPPLMGILHAAADLSSAPVAELDEARLLSMLRPKVGGTWNLHRLSAGHDLDFFVIFSSTTALLGATGLAHYAAANAFLDAFAHYRRGLGLPALSINWGTWSIMRAASSAEQARVAESGLEQMPAAAALALLGDLLAQPSAQSPAQAVVAAVNWGALKPVYEARRRRPLLALLDSPAPTPVASAPVSMPVGAAPSSAPVAPLATAWREARPEDRPDLLAAALRGAVARIAGMADPAAIDLHLGLFEMGLDSLMSIELKTWLERQVGSALPSTLTFNYPTIDDLAGYLEQNVLAASLETANGASAAREGEPVAHAPGSDRAPTVREGGPVAHAPGSDRAPTVREGGPVAHAPGSDRAPTVREGGPVAPAPGSDRAPTVREGGPVAHAPGSDRAPTVREGGPVAHAPGSDGEGDDIDDLSADELAQQLMQRLSQLR